MDVHRLDKPTTDITPLLDAIIKDIPAPKVQEGTPQMLIRLWNTPLTLDVLLSGN